MRLVAIINFWDGGEILPYALKNWLKLGVDTIIIYSDRSNHGETTDNKAFLKWVNGGTHIFNCEPLQSLKPADNETRKRNFGLEKARQLGYTHFITSDCDEFYESIPGPMKASVVPSQVYFKSPTLTIGRDITLVPFIHELTPHIRHGFNRNYPYAFSGHQIRIDPTRQLNLTSGVEYLDNIVLHHYSWCRIDPAAKVRNSTARSNLERSRILNDLVQAKEGYFCEFYERSLVRTENRFNIPEIWPSEKLSLKS